MNFFLSKKRKISISFSVLAAAFVAIAFLFSVIPTYDSVFLDRNDNKIVLKPVFRFEPDNVQDVNFGYSHAINEKYSLIGSYTEGQEREVYVFNNTSGQKLYKFAMSNETLFGVSIALYRDLALIGAPGNNEGHGSAYLFNLKSGNLVATFKSKDKELRESFGASVALYGEYALIGSPRYVDIKNKGLGAATLFNVNTKEMIYKFQIPGQRTQRFGKLVGLNKKYVIIYSPKDDPFKAKSSIYVFNLSTQQKIWEFHGLSLKSFDLGGSELALIYSKDPDTFISYVYKNFLKKDNLISILNIEEQSFILNELPLSQDRLSINNKYLITANSAIQNQEYSSTQGASVLNFLDKEVLFELVPSDKKTERYVACSGSLHNNQVLIVFWNKDSQKVINLFRFPHR